MVALELRSETSEMAVHGTTERNGPALARMVQRRSAPVGVPLAAMDDMEETYAKYVRTIVQADLERYVRVAYFPQDSALAKRLLGIVCSFYLSGLTAGSEVGRVHPFGSTLLTDVV